MENLIESVEYKGYSINIYPDDTPEDPRSWDNLGTMVCFHRSYELGDKHDLSTRQFNSWNEVETYLIQEEDAYIILPLYLYDHSGLRIKIGSFQGLLPQGHAEFDSGMIGFIYVTAEKIREEYGVKHISKNLKKRVAEYLQNEIYTYDSYLSGSVYGFSVTDSKGNDIDSCWGYYDTEYMIHEAKDIIDRRVSSERKKHYDRLKNQIKNRVPFQYRSPLDV